MKEMGFSGAVHGQKLEREDAKSMMLIPHFPHVHGHLLNTEPI